MSTFLKMEGFISVFWPDLKFYPFFIENNIYILYHATARPPRRIIFFGGGGAKQIVSSSYFSFPVAAGFGGAHVSNTQKQYFPSSKV